MGSQDQALSVQSKKTSSSHHRGKYSHQRSNFRKPREKFKFIFYICDERGHFARDCTRKKISSHKKKGNKRRHHAHAIEDGVPSRKKIRQDSDDSSSDEEYVFIYAIMGNITHGSNDWLIYSGASKHMT